MSEPPIGHNIPPEGIEFAALQDRTTSLVENANHWINERPEILNEDMATKADDFLNQLRKQIVVIDTERKAQNEPHSVAIKETNTRFHTLTKMLETAQDIFKRPVMVWLNKQEETRKETRKETQCKAEIEAREAEEAAKKAATEAEQGGGDVIGKHVVADEAAQKAKDTAAEAGRIARTSVGIKGDYSAKSRGFRTTRKARIKDFDEAFKYYRDHPDVAAVLTKLACADIRHGRQRIPGFETYEEKSVA